MRRSTNQEEHENHERWLVSYADFITLLFAFFVVLYATSESNEKKKNEFQKSIKKYFLGAISAGPSGEASGSGKGEKHKYDAIIDSPIKRFNKLKAATRGLQKNLESLIESQISTEETKKYILDIYSDERGARLILNANKIYKSKGARLKESSFNFLDKMASIIKKLERQIVIENHISTALAPGDEYSRWGLTSARSARFLSYLHAQHNLSYEQLVPVGFASTRPRVPRGADKRNSRIELVFKDLRM